MDGTIPEAFLAALLQAHRGRLQEAAATWEKLLRVAFTNLRDLKFTDGHKVSDTLFALDVLFRQPVLQHALVRRSEENLNGGPS